MDSEQNSSNPINSQHQKVQHVAQQLLKAINQPSSQTESNIIIFLNKLYKNNTSIKNKKMKSIRLSRFINLIEYIVNQFPTKKQDTQILYHCIVSTLLNQKNFYDEQGMHIYLHFVDYQLIYALAVEISKVIEKLSNGQFGFLAGKLLSHLITNQNINLTMDATQFEQNLKKSTYYQTINLDSKPSTNIHQENYPRILEQSLVSNVILDNICIQKVYSQLFKSSQDKFNIVNLFYQHIQKLQKNLTKSRKQLFIECFISSNDKLTVCQAQALLKILQSTIFDRQTINQVVNKITQDKLPLQDLILIDFKKIKGIEQVFVQCLLQQTLKKTIDQIINLFINMKDQYNYFPLYLILKLNKKIPLDYATLFFEDQQLFNIRRAIIFTLAIIDNQQNSFDNILKYFLSWNQIEKVRTKKHYQCILKSIHFSLQNISKANIISQILRFIHKKNLNAESYLQFLTYNALKVSTHEEMKIVLTETNRQALNILFKTLSQFDKMTKNKNNYELTTQQLKQLELEHKYRLDLQFMLNSNPFVEQQIMISVKELNKMLDGSVSIEELLKQLPSLKQNLLEVTLMWINNKYDTFYTEQINNTTIDWALKTYKKYTSQLNNELKTLLQKQKLDKYFKLVKTLIEYGMQKQSQLKINTQNTKIFTPAIKKLINCSNSKNQRMNSTNFNDYFLTQSKWKNFVSYQEKSVEKTYKKVVWIKTLIIQIKQLIKNMIKAQKTATKKQVKNVIAENLVDVLAFKSIHEYFDSQVQQGKQILIEIFRSIQPQLQFFDKTQALASSLSIEFYSIFQELPNLLEHFNSDSLIFLSKLITNQKPGTQEKKKKNKKKNQKDNQLEDIPSINTILKNFNLLFSDPNTMQSYKSLFTILRKLVETDKIDKNQLQANLNAWLSQINFISCSSFQSWKNKVLSLSKMWKNAADLLTDKKIQKKFDIKVLQKHFNLFTDLLNKLYENFRHQQQFIELQQRILLSLCLIYKKQDFSDQIQPENDMIDFIIKRFQQRNISRIILGNKFYYCYQCKKHACYACSSFLHRNHDKIYTGKTGNCQHENAKSKKDPFLKSQHSASMFGGVSAILKKNEDLPQQLLERISQKILLQEQLRANQDGQYVGVGRMHSQNIRQLLEGRIPKNRHDRSEQIKRKIREKQNQLKSQMRSQDKKQIPQDEKSITPQAEQYFQYKQPYCKEFKKIHSELNPVIPKIYIAPTKINVSPLSKVFLRQLQNQHFHYQQNQLNQNQIKNKEGALVEEIKDKYLFFKNNNLKGDNRDYPYGRGRGGYGGFTYGSNPRDATVTKRSILACSKKHLFIPSSLSMMNLSMAKIKEKLQKKIQGKQISVQQQEKNYVLTPPANLPFDVVETSISQSSTNPVLAAVGLNQICFYSINADGRFGRQINPQFHRMDNILKFTWINERKNLFAIAYNNYIRIGGVSPSNNSKTFAKAQIGKTIRDFDGYMNSKLYMLFIIDNEGKLYFIEVDFKQGKNAAYSSADRLINLVDEQGKILPNDIYSVKNIDGNRLLFSCQNGTIRVAQINRDANIWKVSTFDLKKTMTSDLPIILETIKIIKTDDQSIYLSGIARKFKAFENKNTRKCSGFLLVMKIHQNIYSSSIAFTRQENIQSFDFTFISSGTLAFVYANDEGMISFFKHCIDLQPSQIVQKITPSMDNNSIKTFCKKLIANNVFDRIQDGAMLKNLQFKQNKQLTGNFTVNIREKQQITIKQLYPSCTHFVSGISFQVELPSSVTQYTGEENIKQQECVAIIRLKCIDSSYIFYCNSKKRQIQIPFNLKQTISMFSHQNQMRITYTVQINEEIVQKQKYTAKELEEFVKIKNVHIYGFEARDLSTINIQQPTSIYHTAFKQLFNDWCIYQEYQKDGFEEYLLNFYRFDFYNVDMKRLYKLKYDNANQGCGFKMDEINLFLKLQLFSQTVAHSLLNDKSISKGEIEQYLNCIKKELLSKEYKRKSLENSAYRLCQSVCYVYEKKVPVTVGHPYHKESLIHMHHFVVSYKKWLQKKNIVTFDNLGTLLSNLILTQAIDLHLILQACPQLMIQLSLNFKKIITERKHKQFSQQQSQISITRICSKYIAILCEYYQIMKNKSIESTQQKLLYLLEQVFGHAKSDMPKQLIMNPFLYLESILNLNQFTQIDTSIQLFFIQNSSQFDNSFFDLEKAQKYHQKIKKQTSSMEIKQEELLLNENSNYEAIIQQEKQMDQQEKQMYMQIEQDFDDEDEMAMDDVQALELQIQKQKSSLKDINVIIQTQQLSSQQKNLDENLTKLLIAQSLPQIKKITVNHYDFPLQLAIALFRKENYLTSSNVYFYLGLLYNLLKIIQNNLKIRQNKNKILEFIQTIDKRLQHPDYSSLFIVLNFFISPRYVKTSSGLTIKKSQSSLSQHFSNYYLKNNYRFGQLLTTYNPTIYSPISKLSQIMRFTAFQMKNQLYNLKLLSNLYLSFRLLGNNFFKSEEKAKIKEELLFKLVKYKITTLKNIMIYQRWQNQLDRAKILVSYEILLDEHKKIQDKEQGINMLYRCAIQTPDKYIQELLKDQSKVSFLEDYSLLHEQVNQNIQKKVFQLLEIYYKS